MSEDLYKENILELYRHPHNRQVLTVCDMTHRELNPTCGDDITVQIALDTAGNINDIGFQGVGCALSTAAMSVVGDAVKGRNRENALGMTLDDVSKLLGIDVIYSRQNCAVLGLRAVQNALRRCHKIP